MQPNLPFSPPSAWKRPSASRSTFRQADFWLACWRGMWLAIAFSFVIMDWRGETTLMRPFDHKRHPASVWIAASVGAVAAFPFDRSLRQFSTLMLERIAENEK